MPIQTNDKAAFDAAMDVLAEQLKEDGISLSLALKRAMLKTHPDKNLASTTAEAQFKIMETLYKAIQEYLRGAKPSVEAKQEMSSILDQLPAETGSLLVDKLIRENPSIDKRDLLNPVSFSVSNNYIGYANSPLEGRSHVFEVNADNFSGLKDKFQEMRGDFLKTEILADFQSRIENTSTQEELKILKEEIKKS